MRRNRILEIPATTVIAAIGAIAVSILLIFAVVSLLAGALKEVFYYVTSSQGFSTKNTSSESSAVSVLVTQE